MFLARENKVVAHRELRENLQQLECPAHAQPIEVARAHACRKLVIDAHLARARLQLAEHAIEQRGFSRSVWSDDAEDFSGTDFNETPSTATMPPKALRRLVTSSTAVMLRHHR
jgi:hypothetical protein